MSDFTLTAIHTKQNDKVASYVDVIFETNKGLYKVQCGDFSAASKNELAGYFTNDFVFDLRQEHGVLTIDDIRVEYDCSMYFLLSNKVLLVLGYQPNTYSQNSDQNFWTVDDIYGINKSELDDFLGLRQVVVPFSCA